jgi:hypothetical protein
MGKHRWKGELATPIGPKVIRPGGLRVSKKQRKWPTRKWRIFIGEQSRKNTS